MILDVIRDNAPLLVMLVLGALWLVYVWFRVP